MLLLWITASSVLGQRLSQGASDWYMRFHDFDQLVKRDGGDRPVTTLFYVDTLIRHRFAVTTVTTRVENPSAERKQLFRFGLVMPKEALVSAVVIDPGEDLGLGVSKANLSNWFR